MFIRFVRTSAVSGMSAREGFFCAAYEMRANPETPDYALDHLEDLLTWFRENLAVPDRFTKSKSTRADEGDTRGLSWFKHDAGQVLDKSRELIALLELQGYVIETLRSDRVGYVIYEDAHQVVAEPFAETPT